MISTSDKAVTDYVNSLLMDVSFGSADLPSIPDALFKPQDSISVGQQVQITQDAFSFMQLTQANNPHELWLAIHSLLKLVDELPHGAVKTYALRQCQTLFHVLNKQEV